MKKCNITMDEGYCSACKELYVQKNPGSDKEPGPRDYMEVGPDKDGGVRWYSCGHVYYVRPSTGEFRFLGTAS